MNLLFLFRSRTDEIFARLRWLLGLRWASVFLDRASKAWIDSRPEVTFRSDHHEQLYLVLLTESRHRLQLSGGYSYRQFASLIAGP